MEIINIKINKIKPYKNNPRKNDTAIEYVMESIKQFGVRQPITLDSDYNVVCGHTRLEACKKLKINEVPCVIIDGLTEEQIKAYRLVDNKVSEFSEWDINLLDIEMSEILNINLEEFGFINPIDEDIIESSEDFELPDGDKEPFQQMTFTLHDERAELIRYAIDIVKDNVEETFGNKNKNGNAIYEVVRQWAELKK